VLTVPGTLHATVRWMPQGLLRRSLLAAGLVLAACYAPTLPLPPPQKPEITLTESGEFRLRGAVEPNAQIFALNERNTLIDGQQLDRTGRYDFTLRQAVGGDLMQIWYQVGTDLSPTTVFTLPDDLGGAGGEGGAGP